MGSSGRRSIGPIDMGVRLEWSPIVTTMGKNYESDRERVEISDRKNRVHGWIIHHFSAVSILRLVDFDNQNEVPEKTHNFFPLETSQKVCLAADLDRFKHFPELLRTPKF